ncbi:MAG: hypothetical protein Kow0080_31410 [Candidatus Promineifilaceae bacterium]
MAGRDDASAVFRLLGESRYSHIHVDWYVPGDWLGTPGFVVWDTAVSSETPPFNPLAQLSQSTLAACLAVAADPLPAAWVRVAAVREPVDVLEAVGRMLNHVLPWLVETAVTELAWLPIAPWPNDVLPQLGFQQVNAIETYVKHGMDIPPIPDVPGLAIHPVQTSDMANLAKLEEEAFDPIWRHSAQSLLLARPQTISFDVAFVEGEAAGFQFSTQSQQGAHLVRLTVHPKFQGKGVGSALLAHALEGYKQRGIYLATLNTQLDNTASQHLYQKFGFEPNGHRLPIWSLPVVKMRD